MSHVRFMRSHDYCHFEFQLDVPEKTTLAEINRLRKVGQRLADEAVRQYDIAKEMATKRLNLASERQRCVDEVKHIKENVPEADRSAEQKAKVTALQDHDHWSQFDYDYGDDGLEAPF